MALKNQLHLGQAAVERKACEIQGPAISPTSVDPLMSAMRTVTVRRMFRPGFSPKIERPAGSVA